MAACEVASGLPTDERVDDEDIGITFLTAGSSIMTTSASIVALPAAIERTAMNQADPTQETPQDLELVAEELVVEEVSIDGMCGVY